MKSGRETRMKVGDKACVSALCARRAAWAGASRSRLNALTSLSLLSHSFLHLPSIHSPTLYSSERHRVRLENLGLCPCAGKLPVSSTHSASTPLLTAASGPVQPSCRVHLNYTCSRTTSNSRYWNGKEQFHWTWSPMRKMGIFLDRSSQCGKAWRA